MASKQNLTLPVNPKRAGKQSDTNMVDQTDDHKSKIRKSGARRLLNIFKGANQTHSSDQTKIKNKVSEQKINSVPNSNNSVDQLKLSDHLKNKGTNVMVITPVDSPPLDPKISESLVSPQKSGNEKGGR